MKAIRVLALLCACFALTLAIGCGGGDDDAANGTNANGASQPDGDSPGEPILDGGVNEGMGIGDE